MQTHADCMTNAIMNIKNQSFKLFQAEIHKKSQLLVLFPSDFRPYLNVQQIWYMNLFHVQKHILMICIYNYVYTKLNRKSRFYIYIMPRQSLSRHVTPIFTCQWSHSMHLWIALFCTTVRYHNIIWLRVLPISTN